MEFVVGNSSPGHFFTFDYRIEGVYDSNSGEFRMFLFDPITGRNIEYSDGDNNGVYDTDAAYFFGDILLQDSSQNNVTDISTISNTATLNCEVTRRTGDKYKFQLVDVSGTWMGRLVSITNPQGWETTFQYKTFTPAQLASSPARKLQIDKIIDGAGNQALITYNSAQQAGRWAISGISIHSNDTLAYTYDTNGNLQQVSRNGKVKSSFCYGTDDDWQATTVAFDELMWDRWQRDTVFLTQDTVNWGGGIISQYPGLLLGRADGTGHRYLRVLRHASTPGLWRVMYRGRAFEWYQGFYLKYFTSFLWNGGGTFDDLSGTFETMYASHVGSTTTEADSGKHAQLRDATGFIVNVTYDNNGNVTQKTYSDNSKEVWQYDSKNQVTYYSDREERTTLITRDSSNRVEKIATGLFDKNQDGSYVARTPARQTIFGYYGTGHASEGMLKWVAVEAFLGGAVVEPSVNVRTDIEYNNRGLVSKIIKPKPTGQSSRPEIIFGWTSDHLASVTNEKGEPTYLYQDELGRVIKREYYDGSSAQIWYDDDNRIYYQKNRMDAVSKVEWDLAGRAVLGITAYGHDTDLSDETISTINGVNESNETILDYDPGELSPKWVTTNGDRTLYFFDYRARLNKIQTLPRNGIFREIVKTYVENLLFKTEENFGSFTKRTFVGRNADRLEVREITTRDSSTSYANNAAVMNLTRQASTTTDPTYVIQDIIVDRSGNVVQHINGNGAITERSVDDLAQIVSVVSGSGLGYEQESTFDYDSKGNVVEATNPAGIVTQYVYGDANDLVSETVGYGTSEALTTQYSYTIDGKIDYQKLPNNGVFTNDRIVQYAYNTCCGQTVGVKNPVGDGTITNVDSEGRTVHTATVRDYDSHTSLINPTESLTESETTTRYRDDGRVSAVTLWNEPIASDLNPANPDIAGLGGIAANKGTTVQFVYDNNLIDNVGLDSTSGITITRLGNSAGTANINIKAALDQLDDPVASGGGEVTFVTHRTGSASVAIAPDEKSMKVVIRDAGGRNVMQALLAGPATNSPNSLLDWQCIVYDKSATFTGVGMCEEAWLIDRDGKKTRSVIDGHGNLVGSYDQLGKLERQKHDAAGNVLVSIDRMNKSSLYTFDLLNRQLTATAPVVNNVTSTFTTEYNATTGYIDSVTDARGNATEYSYDVLGRKSVVTDREGKNTTFTYNGLGLLASVQDQTLLTTSYAYDPAGRINETTYSDGGIMSVLEFDGSGRQTEVEHPTGRIQMTTYHFNGTVDKVQYTGQNGVTVNETEDYSYDNYGRLVSVNSSKYGITQSISYDDRGQIASETVAYNGKNYVVNYGRNNRGEVETITYPSGRVTEYTRDSRRQLDLVKWGAVGSTSTVANFDYNDNGLVIKNTTPSVVENRYRDDASRISSLVSSYVGSLVYKFDENSNVLGETQTGNMSIHSLSTEKPGNSTNPTGYDKEDRFVRFIRSGISEDFYFNRNSAGDINTISRSFSGSSSTTSITRGDLHEVTDTSETVTTGTPPLSTSTTTTTTQTFETLNSETDGNVDIMHSGENLNWDDAGRLTSANVSTSAGGKVPGFYEYGYVGAKRIWKKKKNSSGVVVEHKVYIYAGANCIAEYNASAGTNSPTQEYIYGDEIDSLLMIVNSSGLKIGVSRDWQNSVIALYNLDTGGMLERYTYDQTGKRKILAPNGTTVRNTSNYSNPYGYTGRRHDETGLVYFRYRYYDPVLGEFVSRDPLGFVDGPSLYRGYHAMFGTDPWGLLLAGDGWDWWGNCAVHAAVWLAPKAAAANQYSGQVNTYVWTGTWVDPSCPASRGVDQGYLVVCGLGTGGKAVVNGCSSAVVSTVTIGYVDGVTVLEVTDFDRAAGYDAAEFTARIGGEIFVGLTPGQLAKLKDATKIRVVFKAASGCEKSLDVIDTATNAKEIIETTTDICNNGFNKNNATSLIFTVAGCSGQVGGAKRGLPGDPGLDFVDDGTRLGGQLYDPGKLAKLEGYLEKRGVRLKVGDEFVPAGKAGGFAQDGSSLVLRSNPTQYEVWHELAHFIQFQKLGKDAYMKLPRSTTFNAPEQHVFDLLENSKKRWNALNCDEQQHAIDYIERIGGCR